MFPCRDHPELILSRWQKILIHPHAFSNLYFRERHTQGRQEGWVLESRLNIINILDYQEPVDLTQTAVMGGTRVLRKSWCASSPYSGVLKCGNMENHVKYSIFNNVLTMSGWELRILATFRAEEWYLDYDADTRLFMLVTWLDAKLS